MDILKSEEDWKKELSGTGYEAPNPFEEVASDPTLIQVAGGPQDKIAPQMADVPESFPGIPAAPGKGIEGMSASQQETTSTEGPSFTPEQLEQQRKNLEESQTTRAGAIEKYQAALEKIRAERANKSGGAEQGLLKDLSTNEKRDMWSKIISGLGQVVAGGVGLHTGLGIGGAYKPTNLYDKQSEDALAQNKHKVALDKVIADQKLAEEMALQERDTTSGLAADKYAGQRGIAEGEKTRTTTGTAASESFDASKVAQAEETRRRNEAAALRGKKPAGFSVDKPNMDTAVIRSIDESIRIKQTALNHLSMRSDINSEEKLVKEISGAFSPEAAEMARAYFKADPNAVNNPASAVKDSITKLQSDLNATSNVYDAEKNAPMYDAFRISYPKPTGTFRLPTGEERQYVRRGNGWVEAALQSDPKAPVISDAAMQQHAAQQQSQLSQQQAPKRTRRPITTSGTGAIQADNPAFRRAQSEIMEMAKVLPPDVSREALEYVAKVSPLEGYEEDSLNVPKGLKSPRIATGMIMDTPNEKKALNDLLATKPGTPEYWQKKAAIFQQQYDDNIGVVLDKLVDNPKLDEYLGANGGNKLLALQYTAWHGGPNTDTVKNVVNRLNQAFSPGGTGATPELDKAIQDDIARQKMKDGATVYPIKRANLWAGNWGKFAREAGEAPPRNWRETEDNLDRDHVQNVMNDVAKQMSVSNQIPPAPAPAPKAFGAAAPPREVGRDKEGRLIIKFASGNMKAMTDKQWADLQAKGGLK